jgi:hypothetical protein
MRHNGAEAAEPPVQKVYQRPAMRRAIQFLLYDPRRIEVRAHWRRVRAHWREGARALAVEHIAGVETSASGAWHEPAQL